MPVDTRSIERVQISASRLVLWSRPRHHRKEIKDSSIAILKIEFCIVQSTVAAIINLYSVNYLYRLKLKIINLIVAITSAVEGRLHF